MLIRFANESDIPDIVDINIKTWRTTYTGIIHDSTFDLRENNKIQNIKIMKEKLVEGKTKFLVAVLNNQIIGFVSYGEIRVNSIKEDNLAEIYAIYILKDYQNLGIGKKLISFVARYLEKNGYTSLFIWTLEDNPNKNFYIKIGGEQVLNKDIDIYGQNLKEIAFLYKNLSKLFF